MRPAALPLEAIRKWPLLMLWAGAAGPLAGKSPAASNSAAHTGARPALQNECK